MKKEYLQQQLDKVYRKLIHLEKVEINEVCPIGIVEFEVWEWPQGVGLYGLFQYYMQTKDEKILDYLTGWYERRMKEGLPEKNVNTMAPMLTLACLYELTGEHNYYDLCKDWAEYALMGLPRTEEGGMQHMVTGNYNEQQLWDDTLVMTVLFLAKWGTITKQYIYCEEAEYQFLVHIKYLYDTKTGLWYHGWNFLKRDHFAGALWARGNCWITVGIPELLDIMEITPAVKRFLLQTLEAQIIGLKRYQCQNGMWHTLLDDESSYTEASATAGFGYGILKAVRMGYISNSYYKEGQKALEAVLACIAEDGTVKQVSYGTGMGDTLQHYRDIEICPMAYGQSLAIMLLQEAIKQQNFVEE